MGIESLIYSVLADVHSPVEEEITTTLLSIRSKFFHRWCMHDPKASRILSHINLANPAGLTAWPLCCTTSVTWAGGSCICMKLVVRAISPCSSLCMSWATPKVAAHTVSTGTTSFSQLSFSDQMQSQKCYPSVVHTVNLTCAHHHCMFILCTFPKYNYY